jgi:CHASE3 domain sensor protein
MDRRKRRINHHTVLKIIVVVAAMYLIGIYFTLSAKLDKASAEYEELKKAHAVAEQDTAELSDVASNIDNGEYIRGYIIKIAHQNGYILPGEKIFVDVYEK